MSIFDVIIFGIIQGLTEFLPVSSSAHLLLIREFFGFSKINLIFSIVLHIGTLLAILIVLRREIVGFFKVFWNFFILLEKYGGLKKFYIENELMHFLVLIFVSSIPTIFLGFLLSSLVGSAFELSRLIGMMLIFSGTIIWFAIYKLKNNNKTILQMTLMDSFIIGVFQGLSVIPGISRSGFTISAGLFLGMKVDLAVKYSFLISIPTVFGAMVLNFCSSGFKVDIPVDLLCVGIFVSALVGIMSFKFMLKFMGSNWFKTFAVYCCICGFMILFFIRVNVI